MFFVVVIFIQFIPTKRSNPPKAGEILTRQEVKQLLKRSCYDCHSNDTKWPSYSYVAPLSWYFISEVEKGRKKLNFSNWNRLSKEEQDKLLVDIWDEVEDGDMPPPQYLWLHSEKGLSASDKDLIYRWTHGLLPEF